MEDKQEKLNNDKKKNIIKFSILVAIFLVVLIITSVVHIVNESKTTATGSNADGKEELNENVVDTVNLEDLTKVANKTEEELQEINKKELEEAEKKEQEKKTTTSAKKTQNKYYIKVNYGAQVVNVYTYDKNGNYTVPVKAFVCSTGTATPTSGVYSIPIKMTWCHMYGDVWGHYCSQIVGDILFHSVPYLEKNNHSLEYWAYDKLGTKASMGCIRLTTIDAKWIFDNVSVGTKVEFYSSSNPGPLGKPSAQKISDAPGDLKWWDPTDPDVNNPWRTYKPETDNNNQIQNDIVQNDIVQNDIVQNGQSEENKNEVNENQTNQTDTNMNINTNQTNPIQNEQTENNIQNEQTDNSESQNTQLEDNKNEQENSSDNTNETINNESQNQGNDEEDEQISVNVN